MATQLLMSLVRFAKRQDSRRRGRKIASRSANEGPGEPTNFIERNCDGGIHSIPA